MLHSGSLAEAVLVRKHDCLGTGPHTEFVEEVRSVVTDRLLADGKTFGDFAVCETFCHQSQDFAFAGRKGFKDRIARSRWIWNVHEVQHCVAESRPGRLVLQQNMVGRIQFYELCTGDPAGDETAFGY